MRTRMLALVAQALLSSCQQPADPAPAQAQPPAPTARDHVAECGQWVQTAENAWTAAGAEAAREQDQGARMGAALALSVMKNGLGDRYALVNGLRVASEMEAHGEAGTGLNRLFVAARIASDVAHHACAEALIVSGQ